MTAHDIAEIIANLPDVSVAAPFSALKEVGGDFNMPFGRDAISTGDINMPFGRDAISTGDINMPFGRDAIDVSTTDSHDKTTTVSGFLNPNITAKAV